MCGSHVESFASNRVMARAWVKTGRPLADVIDEATVEAAPQLVAELPDGKVRCVACTHRCKIAPGKRGICQVRYHDADSQRLRVPAGYVAAVQIDPIEKKPFHHVLPGELALTFGMLGCDMHCGYCQNWLTSQALRDCDAGVRPHEISATELVELALGHGARMIVSSYNEPLITAEWAHEIFREAKAHGLRTGFVSNGSATAEVLDYLLPVLDAYKIDLKSMEERSYRRLGGLKENVLRGMELVHERGLWLEVVSLIVPGFNDSDAEVRAMAEAVAAVSTEIPWHVTAFHRDYRMKEHAETQVTQLTRAAQIGREVGLSYVYAGNAPGRVGEFEHTRCAACEAVLIERHGIQLHANRVAGEGRCPQCDTAVPGIWS